jgi:hypothetical protein
MTFSWTDFSFQPFTVSAFRFVPVEQRALGLLLAEVSSIRRRTKWDQAAGRRFFTCDRANLWSEPFLHPFRVAFIVTRALF